MPRSSDQGGFSSLPPNVAVLPERYGPTEMSVPGEDSSIAFCMCLDALLQHPGPPVEPIYFRVSGGQDRVSSSP